MLALENAEERADAAENSLMKVRSRTRSEISNRITRQWSNTVPDETAKVAQ